MGHLAKEDSEEESRDINSNEVSDVDDGSVMEENEDIDEGAEDDWGEVTPEISSIEEVVEEGGDLEENEDSDEDGEDAASEDDSNETIEDEDNSVKKSAKPGELSCCLWGEGMGSKCPIWTQRAGYCHKSPENCEGCSGRWTSGEGVEENAF